MCVRKLVYKILLCLVVLCFPASLLFARQQVSYKFGHISIRDGLPTNEINGIFQDSDGYIWFATRSGLCVYDGYSIRTFKSNLYTPGLLNNNDIYSIAEDGDKRLWFGTTNGLNVLDKKTGKIRAIANEELNESLIPRILFTRKGEMLIATERGLRQYFPETNECKPLLPEQLDGVSVKDLKEDSKGNLWIGTWGSGLFRYDPESATLHSYPPFSPEKAANTIYVDSRQRVWVGTWDSGLYLIENPYETDRLRIVSFNHEEGNTQSLADHYVYDISEDLTTGYIWVGTRNGLSVLTDEKSRTFNNIHPDNSQHSLSYNAIQGILRDGQGIMWIGTQGGGVNMATTYRPAFGLNKLENVSHRLLYNPSIRTVIVDRKGIVWLGLGVGFLRYNRMTGRYTHNLDAEEFAAVGNIPTVNTIYQSPTSGRIWIGTYDRGLVVYDESAPAGSRACWMNRESHSWINNQCIFSILEDRNGNTWFGNRNGINVLLADGRGVNLDNLLIDHVPLSFFSIVALVEDTDGSIWAGTGNGGIFHITGNPAEEDGLKVAKYTPENGKINNVNTLCLFLDNENRLWAGSKGGGLSLYDREKDIFQPLNRELSLPADAIVSIQQDGGGNLWLGSNAGLIRLHYPGALEGASYRLYTLSDGLQDDEFNRNSAFTDINGEMFFGGHHGFNYFFPDRMYEDYTFPPVKITDLMVYNQSWNQLDNKTQRKISPLAPDFTNRIRLNYRQNNFSLEFAALGYINPRQIQYAYRLKGFDSGWQYTDATRRFAYYNNLEPGNYTFELKATNANGVWNEKDIQTIGVQILPPPWKTAWAYLVYFLLILLASYAAYRMVRQRIKQNQALQLAEMEQAKRDEVNHSKLMFFTNITHELLTPLTILSASVDELKMIAPQQSRHYKVMTAHINRLIRLLQQILEFRKAESGNLRLKVSKGDLVQFVHNSIESFRPLIKKKQMTFTFECDEIPQVYFDPDKWDKILYNLLSNAAKYNTPGSEVDIRLTYRQESGLVTLSVKDNGKGMTEEEKRQLFKRFYQGDHRKFNTIGTGIGLSLTHDLVTLHKGSIQVESEPGAGSEFIVKIPVSKSIYTPGEIDDVEIQYAPVAAEVDDDEIDTANPFIALPDKKYTLLLVEDNEDLLQLMVRLLGIEYNILTARSGEEGLVIVEQEEVDVIVSDIMMPGMDGIAFCQQVKGKLETSHIPMILLTAKSREEDRVEGYESGADGFLTKPFNLSVLHARIRNLVKTKERSNRDFKNQLVFEAKELHYTSLDEDFLQRAINLVHQHLDNPDFDQHQFQEAMKTSKSTLYRKIKSLTGLNTSAFIRNIRLKAACRLMEEKGQIRISELAYAVGFNDPKYFSVCFKKEFGMQPSEYLERFVPPGNSTE